MLVAGVGEPSRDADKQSPQAQNVHGLLLVRRDCQPELMPKIGHQLALPVRAPVVRNGGTETAPVP